MRKRIIAGAGIVVALFLGIQLVPVWLWQTNPPVVAEPAWDSPETRALAQRACFDCHSNETTFPWYSRLAPISWLVTSDVVRARDHLNFSEWTGTRGARGVRELDRVLQRGQMPPANYVLLHPDAKLTDAERQQLLEGLRLSLH